MGVSDTRGDARLLQNRKASTNPSGSGVFVIRGNLIAVCQVTVSKEPRLLEREHEIMILTTHQMTAAQGLVDRRQIKVTLRLRFRALDCPPPGAKAAGNCKQKLEEIRN